MTVRGSQNVRTSAALTASYVAGDSTVDCTAADEVILLVSYTMGSGETANNILIKCEWSEDGGTTYYCGALPLPLEESQTNGEVEVDKQIIAYSADSAAATYDYIAVPIKVLAELLKVSVLEEGKASNFGTCAIRAKTVCYR